MKNRPKYGLFDNLQFLLRRLWALSRKLTIYVFLYAPVTVGTAYAGVMLSREVVTLAERGSTPVRVVLTVGALTGVLIIARAAEKCLDAAIPKLMIMADISLQIELLDVLIRGDYEKNETTSGLTRLSKAMENVGSDSSGVRRIARLLSSLLAGVFGVSAYASILWRFDVRILAAVVVTTIGSYLLLRRCADWVYKNKDAWKADDRKLAYLLQNAGDFSKAKDIRLYGLSEWFADVFAATLDDRMRWVKREYLYNFRADWMRALLSLLRDMVAYGGLVYLLAAKGGSAGDFVYYFGIVGGVATWLGSLAGELSNLRRFSLGFSEMREFIDYPNGVNNGDGIPLPTETFEIEFRHVCYRYEGGEVDTLHDLSFKIAKGEKLAVVGVNGAGKTTLVKLLCGLYTPTSGQVLVDGHPVNDYNRTAYYTLFAAVFQEIFVLPLTIAENVAAGEEPPDRGRVEDALKRAGLFNKVAALPKGLDTRLIQSVHEEGIDLSGGEMQKLALARALYKGGLALVLDEPTAALDPIAESKIYSAYNDMTAGHTSVFISHRLASTRFCDRILLLDSGVIREEGTHDSLMKARGKYYEMFQVQSQYYKDTGATDELAERTVKEGAV